MAKSKQAQLDFAFFTHLWAFYIQNRGTIRQLCWPKSPSTPCDPRRRCTMMPIPSSLSGCVTVGIGR
ncbi:MAG: hypothetical protein AVDCRST_MAG18-1319 [uncultured Thermomicrobiales bacterium]|uniref:Uncharacterized protein n=1 Tax=uncultured Thermomicrobiales bacterium TaxID=1645740 RepID=A0A6J4V145_9BACT|nr:MAG: hypothetical protein AVDCRST_MAG18-1319 [uncultured Thermomicrobiales bacterium]